MTHRSNTSDHSAGLQDNCLVGVVTDFLKVLGIEWVQQVIDTMTSREEMDNTQRHEQDVT